MGRPVQALADGLWQVRNRITRQQELPLPILWPPHQRAQAEGGVMNWMQIACLGLVVGSVLFVLWCCLGVCADCDDREGKR